VAVTAAEVAAGRIPGGGKEGDGEDARGRGGGGGMGGSRSEAGGGGEESVSSTDWGEGIVVSTVVGKTRVYVRVYT
jgi:hypothetical protein